jgi:subtilisin family serine protease
VDPAEDRRVRNAVFDVISHGIPIVAPSGNDGGGALAIPAAYPHVIAVAGTDEDGRRATFSNQGLGLDVAAPASDIITAAPSFICASGFALFSGTSFSAPAVAGAAALLLQTHPELSPAQVSLMLAGISDSSTPGWERGLGFGIVDVAAALARVVPADDAPEVDDSIAWARRHKPVLGARARSATVTARVTNGKDPADVFRVRLGTGDRLVATVRASTGRVAVSIGDGQKSFGRTLRRAPRAGVYYVTVRAVSSGPAGSPYRLKLRRN